MPPVTKPTKLHILSGAMEKHPERHKDKLIYEPKPEKKLGKPPKYFNKHEKECWNEIVGACVEGVLWDIDRFNVEMAAKLLSGFRTDPDFHCAKMTLLHKTLAVMGMNPSDRSKLRVTPAGEKKEEKKDPWADL